MRKIGMTRSSLLILFASWLIQGCAGDKNFDLVVEFPEPALAYKGVITTLNIYSIRSTADTATCENLNNGTHKPGDEGYSVDDQLSIVRPFSEAPRALKAKKNTGTRLFFIEGVNANNDEILRGCTEVGSGERSSLVTVSLAMVCLAGWGDCDGNPNNGCETNVSATIAHCGKCSNACTNDHGGKICSSGVCAPTCESFWGDCDGNPSNGCETDITALNGCNGHGDCSLSMGTMITCRCFDAFNGDTCERCASTALGVYPQCFSCPANYCISGTMSGATIAGVTITLGGAATATTTTDGSGVYTFSGLADGSYTVTPCGNGYAFSPESLSVTVNGAHVDGQDFTAISCSGRWCLVCPLPQGISFSDVWGSSADDVWVVGFGNIVHWDGTAWSVSYSNTHNGATYSVDGVWGSRADDVWASQGDGSILQWHGTAWFATQQNFTDFLNAFWGSGNGTVWAVGQSGTILKLDSITWSILSSSTTNSLYNVWGSGSNDVWAVGVNGTIVHWNGTAWSKFTSGTTNVLRGVWGSGSNDVWAVGESGTIVHWNGAAWSSVASGTMNGLYDVWGSGAGDVWAVGNNGSILHWSGANWSSVDSGTTNGLSSVWGSGAGDVWAVSSDTILRWRQ